MIVDKDIFSALHLPQGDHELVHCKSLASVRQSHSEKLHVCSESCERDHEELCSLLPNQLNSYYLDHSVHKGEEKRLEFPSPEMENKCYTS